MGLFDIFRMGKVLYGTAKAVRAQRSLAGDLSALPMAELIPACLAHLNGVPGNWSGAARPALKEATELSQARRLPDELAEFYRHCNGFEGTADFPVPVLPIENLRLGGDYSPTLSERLAAFWAENGNDSEQPGMLSVLPPDDLGALVTHSAESHVAPKAMDLALPLIPPRDADFAALLLVDAGPLLPRGTVLEIEGGSATRYGGFKKWLGTHASLYAQFATIGTSR